jgi:hypothetical protein
MKAGGRNLFCMALLAAGFCGAESATNVIERLEPTLPFPALIAAAKTSGIPLEAIDRPQQTNELAIGDSVTALVTVHEKKQRLTQWLMYFEVTGDSTGGTSKKSSPMVVYTSLGNKFEFASSSATLRLRTIGPFAGLNTKRKRPSVEDESAVVSADKDFLSLGFDRGVAAAYRWRTCASSTVETNLAGVFSHSLSAPFDGSRINRGRRLAAQLQITTDEDRAVAGWGPALISYIGTVQQTPNLDTIFLKVLNPPSAWSVLRNRGVSAGIGVDMWSDGLGPLSLRGWDSLPGLAVYSMPCNLVINNRLSLVLTLVVTSPRRPLLACGGIIGLLAENADDKDNYMMLRVISAHCGTGKPGSAPKPLTSK